VDRCAHSHVGGRGCCLAVGRLAWGRGRFRWSRTGGTGPAGARPARNFRRRRYGGVQCLAWQAGPRPCAGCEAGWRLRSQSNPGCSGRPAPPPFRYRHYGSLATIGRQAAVADFGLIRVRGAAAWWLWGAAHIAFLIGVRNRITVLASWLWAYLTFRRSSRLITASGLLTRAPSLTTLGGDSRQRSVSPAVDSKNFASTT